MIQTERFLERSTGLRLIILLVAVVFCTPGPSYAEGKKIKIVALPSCGTVSVSGEVDVASDTPKLKISPNSNCKAAIAINKSLKKFKVIPGVAISYPLSGLPDGAVVDALLVPKNRQFSTSVEVLLDEQGFSGLPLTTISQSGKLIIKGTAVAPFGIRQVNWENRTSGASGKARGTSSWNATPSLIAGRNVLVFRATTLDGVTGSATAVVRVEPGNPFLTAPASLPEAVLSGHETELAFKVDTVPALASTPELVQLGPDGTQISRSAFVLLKATKKKNTYAANILVTAGQDNLRFVANYSAGGASLRSLETVVKTTAATTIADVGNHFDIMEKVKAKYGQLKATGMSEYNITLAIVKALKSTAEVYEVKSPVVGEIDWRYSSDKPLWASFLSPAVFPFKGEDSSEDIQPASFSSRAAGMSSGGTGSSYFFSPYYKNPRMIDRLIGFSNSFGKDDLFGIFGAFDEVKDTITNSCYLDQNKIRARPIDPVVAQPTIEDYLALRDNDVSVIFSHGIGSNGLSSAIYLDKAEYLELVD